MMKKRAYHFTRTLGINQYDLRSLRALRAKLLRDYLNFFEDLSDLYKQSKQKKEIQSTVVKIRQTISLLDSILEGESIGKEDAGSLVSRIDDINADRDYFLQKIPEIKAFSDRIDKVVAKTGISPEDLNITEGVVKGVVKGSRDSQKEGVGSFLRRSMPGTLGAGADVGKGMLTALTGPFASILGPIAKDVFSLGKNVVGKVKERKEMRLGGRLRPVGGQVSSERAEQISEARRESPFVSSFGREAVRGGRESGRDISPYSLGRKAPREKVLASTQSLGKKISKEDQVRPLTYFFDKKAYRTKWTKELLQRLKNLGGKGKGSLFGGLTGGLKSLLPLLAGVGLALGKGAGLAGAVVFTSLKLFELGKTAKEYHEVLKNVEQTKEKQQVVMSRLQQDAFGRLQKSETPEEKRRVMAGIKVYQTAEHKKLYEKSTKGVIGKFASLFVKAPAEFSPTGPRMMPVSSKKKGEEYSKEDLTKVIENSERQNQKLEKAISGLSSSVAKDKQYPDVRGGGVGNQFDSADTLLSDRSAGNLTLSEE